MNLTLKQLRAFVTVAEFESFSVAAERLHLTAGAVSLLIRDMERELGFLLFDRTTRQVGLSRAGRDFLPSADRALRGVQAAAAVAHHVRERASGVIQVAAPLVISSSLLPPVMVAYQQRQPGVMVRPVDCATHELVAMIDDDRADLAIGPDRPTGPGVRRIKLYDCPLAVWFAPHHRFSRKRKVAWSDLRQESVIAAGRDPETVIHQAFAQSGGVGDFTPAYIVENVTTGLGIASAGLGVALAPTFVSVMARRMGLEMRCLEEPLIQRELSVYVSNRRAPTPAIATFMEFVLEHMGAD